MISRSFTAAASSGAGLTIKIRRGLVPRPSRISTISFSMGVNSLELRASLET